MTGKRELSAPRGDKRYVRRDEKGRISESDNQVKTSSQDRRRKANTVARLRSKRSTVYQLASMHRQACETQLRIGFTGTRLGMTDAQRAALEAIFRDRDGVTSIMAIALMPMPKRVIWL